MKKRIQRITKKLVEKQGGQLIIKWVGGDSGKTRREGAYQVKEAGGK